ncbi:4Fe-4S cluster-binding domain-containing protein [Streptomyces blattellae]|uniref:4Fe-4S cluster-binding domain-containing protein n=1 Tax=Streptomyces blattellae TaxID=2569855 RepID=UPI001E56E196|nr:4Fe-4S cluster-binding domain-containing protein [Streptomyces blattellae]
MAGVSGLDAPWRLHAVVPRSAANGPGVRYVVWSQGCALGCPGCFNPQTHSGSGAGVVRTAGEVAEEVLADAACVEGVTVTGGEPLEQPAAVAAFCGAVRARSGLSVIVLSGFSRAEIEADAARSAAVADADVVIAGRYNARLRLARGLRGSANKEYWLRTGRYTAGDLAAVPELEITVTDDGTLTFTGMAAPEGEF